MAALGEVVENGAVRGVWVPASAASLLLLSRLSGRLRSRHDRRESAAGRVKAQSQSLDKSLAAQ